VVFGPAVIETQDQIGFGTMRSAIEIGIHGWRGQQLFDDEALTRGACSMVDTLDCTETGFNRENLHSDRESARFAPRRFEAIRVPNKALDG
jgi:hypothetical protein